MLERMNVMGKNELSLESCGWLVRRGVVKRRWARLHRSIEA